MSARRVLAVALVALQLCTIATASNSNNADADFTPKPLTRTASSSSWGLPGASKTWFESLSLMDNHMIWKCYSRVYHASESRALAMQWLAIERLWQSSVFSTAASYLRLTRGVCFARRSAR